MSACTHTHSSARKAVTLRSHPPLPLTLSGIFPAWFLQVLQTASATPCCLPGHCVGSGITIATWPLWASTAWEDSAGHGPESGCQGDGGPAHSSYTDLPQESQPLAGQRWSEVGSEEKRRLSSL